MAVDRMPGLIKIGPSEVLSLLPEWADRDNIDRKGFFDLNLHHPVDDSVENVIEILSIDHCDEVNDVRVIWARTYGELGIRVMGSNQPTELINRGLHPWADFKRPLTGHRLLPPSNRVYQGASPAQSPRGFGLGYDIFFVIRRLSESVRAGKNVAQLSRIEFLTVNQLPVELRWHEAVTPLTTTRRRADSGSG